LVDRIVVGWDEAAGFHTVEIEGELAALLKVGTNENAAAYEAAASSLKLIAGVRNPRGFAIPRLPRAEMPARHL